MKAVAEMWLFFICKRLRRNVIRSCQMYLFTNKAWYNGKIKRKIYIYLVNLHKLVGEKMKEDKLFFLVMKKIFLGHYKEMRILILCEMILTAISYAIVSGYQMFSSGHSSEYFLQEDGISKSFFSAGMILLFCGMVLIITVLISYLGKRIPEYVFLQRMGISKKDLKKMVLYEAAISYLASIIGGFFVGKILNIGLKTLIIQALNINFKLGKVAFFTYPLICVLILCIYGLSFLLVKELESDFLIITNTKETARVEKLRGKFRIPKIVLGIVLCVYSVYAYSKIYHYESAFLIIMFFAGLYLSLRNILSVFLEYTKRKNEKKYYKNLLKNNRFYYRINTISRYILFFSLMSFLSCFYFGIQFISIINDEKAENLYPYDFMCIADRADDKIFEKIKEKYHATVVEYPMVRVANADKTEHSEGRGEVVIQGQQIGISESTYYKLKKAIDPSYKKKSLKLDKNGKKVYIVHQQDRSTKAQPLDWYYNKKLPDLHIGLPCEYCDHADHETTYYEKIVAGEEISSLTGCYSTPKCENLVVFSDEYFEKAKNEWKDTDVLTGYKEERYNAIYGDEGEPYIVEGPTKLVLIQTDEKYMDQIDRELESKEEKHKYIGNYDSTVKFHYSSKTAILDMKTERAVKALICIYIILTLSVLNWIMLYAMHEMEKKEKTEREQFLIFMGMDKNERKKMNRREWYVYWIIPTIILVISTAFFMRDTMVARMYTEDMRELCELQEIELLIIWIVINGIYFWIMNRKVGKELKVDDK